MKELSIYGNLSYPAQKIVSNALHEVDISYSYDGDAVNGAKAEMYLLEHNGRHTRSVIQRFETLSNVLGFTVFQYELGIMAAAAHDVVYLLDAQEAENEEASSTWLQEQMKQYGDYFPREAYLLVDHMIKGTAWSLDEYGELVQHYRKRGAHQLLGAQSLVLARALGQADIGHFFTPEGPEESHRLYRERYVTNHSPEFVSSLIDFQKKSLIITPALSVAEGGNIHPILCTAPKTSVMKHQEEVLKRLERGDLTTYEEVIVFDRQFAESVR